jgi:hypothetical protein
MDNSNQVIYALGAIAAGAVLAILVDGGVISYTSGTWGCGLAVGWAAKCIWDEGKRK